MITVSMQDLLKHKHVLLLQGKMGTFFNRFATFLKSHDIIVSKINFNAGDRFFYHHDRAFDYTGREEDFGTWLEKFITNHKIDAVVCFGDCRPHHLHASHLCQETGVSFFVFEEGYIRPDFITFEKHGINGFSRLDVSKVSHIAEKPFSVTNTNNRFYRLCITTIIYYIIAHVYRHEYRNYSHYRGMSAWQEAVAWLKAPLRKIINYIPDKFFLSQHLTNKLNEQYFLVCLQVHNDTQITHHSNYSDVKDFIREVIISFSKHADSKHYLVIKHHPLDRGHREYDHFIKKLAKQHSVHGRVFYACDMHLPTIIKHSLGMVVVNSTTGLQSIYHQKPTKALGRSIYNLNKLTDQQPLDLFWKNPQAPNRDFYLRFRKYLIEQTQLNGSFFGTSPWMDDYPLHTFSDNQSQQPPLPLINESSEIMNEMTDSLNLSVKKSV